MNLRKRSVPTEELRDYSKPDYLRISQQSVDGQKGNRVLLSRNHGWINVCEEKGLYRKNCLEASKVVPSPEMLALGRPLWMDNGWTKRTKPSK